MGQPSYVQFHMKINGITEYHGRMPPNQSFCKTCIWLAVFQCLQHPIMLWPAVTNAEGNVKIIEAELSTEGDKRSSIKHVQYCALFSYQTQLQRCLSVINMSVIVFFQKGY